MDPRIPELRMVSTNEAAEILSLHPVTLRQWRSRGIGPAWVKVSPNRAQYRISDLQKFIADRRANPIAA